MNQKVLIPLIVLGLSLSSLTAGIWISLEFTTAPPVQARQQGIPEVTVVDLQQGELERVLFIDVRQGWERALDRIEPSVLIPLPQIESGEAVERIQALMNAYESQAPTVVLYCARGVRSARAQQQLAALGIETVSLQGGITAWREALGSDQDQLLTQRIAIPVTPPG